MSVGLETSLIRKNDNKVTFEIKKEDFETFCSAIGLFKKEFLDVLDAGERDSKEGRVKERKSLLEINKDWKGFYYELLASNKVLPKAGSYNASGSLNCVTDTIQ